MDNRPLSDNEVDDRLKAALNALGEAPGVTVAADTALAAARKALSLLSLGLIAAGVKREVQARPQDSLATDCRTRVATEIRMTVLLKHEEIAQMIGATRETVTRTLSDFRRQKLLEVKGSTFIVADGLQRLATI